MKKATKNNDIFGDHLIGKLEGAGNVAHWNRMMEESDGPTGTVNPTHGRSTQRASAPGAPATIRNAGRRVKGAPLDSLTSVPVHGMPGITAASLAREAAAKARRKTKTE
jgi:hypothetical protein